ncbi:hypothetical protein BGX38DRAFT_1199987 [Terfezia claveryi]|nr:hypothetical protein BGX38DRAFT_1199987 [Terfezia claveryi]
MAPDPIKSAWAYPLLGPVHLLTHLSTLTTHLQAIPTSYFKSTTLFRTLLKTFILTTTVTTLLILTLFKLTDNILFLIGRNFGPLGILARNGCLRNVVALVGLAAQGALIAGRVVEYGVGQGAKRVGWGVLMERMDLKNTVPEMISGDAAAGGGLTQPIKGGATALGGSVEKVVQDPSAAAKSAEKSLEKKTHKEKGISWTVKKLVSIPVASLPVIGPVVYAVMNSEDLGWGYVGEYAKNVGMEKDAQEGVKAFGLAAGILHALPVVGPVFYFSNFVGGALWIADLKAHKEKQTK